MIIGFWIALIICSVIIVGEIKYRYFEKKETEQCDKLFSLKWTESVDVDIDELSIEHIDEDFVPLQSLTRRKSWHLAQSQVVGVKTFNQLMQEEYSKKL